ncbi:Tryptophan-specific transport protein [compost metagenome]
MALTSFGYHHSVSSMRAYYGEERRARYAILGGTAIALLFYLIWLVSVFGNLPRSEFGPVVAQGGNVDVLLKALASVIESEAVANALNLFSMAAILSSFIGVGLGVFDYLADLFKFDNNRQGRAKSWAATFLPPLLLSLLFPFGFLMAIGYAGAVATLWTCIIPALLAWKVRAGKGKKGGDGFRAPGGLPMIVAVFLFGVLTALFHLLNMAGLLPVYTG